MQPSSAKGTKTSDTDSRSDMERMGRRRPFDTRELDLLPRTTDSDPPYRPWWVIDRE
jgi:hypothetical protein